MYLTVGQDACAIVTGNTRASLAAGAVSRRRVIYGVVYLL